MTDDPQTAMLLTEQEWKDLAYMARRYRDGTEILANDATTPPSLGPVLHADMIRRRALALRIIEAV